MNKSISGSGKITEGEYEEIRISGSGRLCGLVSCDSCHTSGTSKGDELICKNAFKVSGESTFLKDLKAGSVSVSGSFTCGGKLEAKERIGCSGSIRCRGDIRCGELSVTGELNVEADIEAEIVRVVGEIECEGLMNAENITIKGAGSSFGSIGGCKIDITRGGVMKKIIKVPVLSSLMKSISGKIEVKTAIEGDEVTLENVHTPRVSGRVVVIGDDCRIDLVQYSESVTISDKAKVGRTEQL